MRKIASEQFLHYKEETVYLTIEEGLYITPPPTPVMPSIDLYI